MKHRFVIHNRSSRLLLIFAGWAMDHRPFARVERPGYDTLVIWDYRDLSFDWSIVAPYKEIALIAWSMGVYAASMTIHAIDHIITARIAVNGTLTPVNNLTGIPEAIFNGTADSLDHRKLLKFFRRVCGDRATTERFMLNAPQRDIAQLIDELRAIHPEPWFANPKITSWDRAVIGRNDAIFPACNQQRAWSGIAPVTVVDRPHYIDLSEIADAYIIDKERAAGRFHSMRHSYEDNTPIQRRIVDSLIDDAYRTGVAKLISSPSAACLEIGCGSGYLSRKLAAMARDGFLHFWDIGLNPPDGIDPSLFSSCDAEIRIAQTQSCRFDIIASASTVQWFNSPRRFISEAFRVLRPGGILLLTAFVRGNMHQLTAAGGVSLNMPDIRQWRAIIPHRFEILSFDTADYDMTFDSPVEVLRHLRLSGVNSLDRSSRSVSGPAIVRHYPRMLDGLCHLTYRTIRMILKKPDNV